MFVPVFSALLVSVDAFFIGLSLGMQQKCKFVYLVVINAFLFSLCMLGFMLAGLIYEHIPFEPDYFVGFAFIGLGLWTMGHYFVSGRTKKHKRLTGASKTSHKTTALVGLVMSTEAMLITMGLTFLFLPSSSVVIPITVALAHFGYSALSFHLARIKQVRRMPIALSHVLSGLALIIYGLMALFVEWDALVM